MQDCTWANSKRILRKLCEGSGWVVQQQQENQPEREERVQEM